MATYQIPEKVAPPTHNPDEVFLIASGDLRLSANRTCWPAQADMERQLVAAFAAEGVTFWNERDAAIDRFKSHCVFDNLWHCAGINCCGNIYFLQTGVVLK